MTQWWEDLFQQTIDCYPNNKPQGMWACEQLLSVPGLPGNIEEATRRNQAWYCQRLDQYGTVTVIDHPHREGWSLFNPSIAATDDGYLACIVRSSNYRIDEAGRYVILDDKEVIRTENSFVYIPRDYAGEKVVPQHDPELIPALDMPNKSDFPVDGVEDARLFWAYEEWWYTGTVRVLNQEGTCQQIRANLNTGWWEVMSPPREHNKNWMPIADDDGYPIVVDRLYPLVTRDMTMGYGAHMADSPYICRSFRGGAAILVGDVYLAVVHEAITMEPYARIYTHRFVEIDAAEETITRVSDPFVFEGRQIEFAAGLAQVGEDLVVSYGVRDAEAHLLRIPLSLVLDDLLREPLTEEVPA